MKYLANIAVLQWTCIQHSRYLLVEHQMLLSFLEMKLLSVFWFLNVHFVFVVSNNGQVCIHFSLSTTLLIWFTYSHFNWGNASVLDLLESLAWILKTWTKFYGILTLIFKRVFSHYGGCVDRHVLHVRNFIFFLLVRLIIVVKSCLTCGRCNGHFILVSFSSQTFDSTHSSKLWNSVLDLRVLRWVYQRSIDLFQIVFLLIITCVFHLPCETFCIVEILS